MQIPNINQEKGKQKAITLRFILVYSFSRATPSLFAN